MSFPVVSFSLIPLKTGFIKLKRGIYTSLCTPMLMSMKNLHRLILIILTILLAGMGGLVAWATLSAQEATERAVSLLNDNGIHLEDGLLVFRPNSTTDSGLIYYPGGLVDPEAYAVTARGIADAGYMVVVPKMPLNLAFMGVSRADGIREDHPEIDSWVIGGHSLGGAMAAEYAKNNVDSLDGLIMFASYPANNEDFIDFPIPVLTVLSLNYFTPLFVGGGWSNLLIRGSGG